VAFWSRDLLRSGGLHWLLEFSWGGQVFRFSEQTIRATATVLDGERQWLEGLVIGGPVADTVDPFSDAPEPRSMNITLHMPPGVDVPDLVSRGFGLGSATGRLMLWLEGTTEAMVLIDGVVRDPEYASKSEPVTFALEELPFDDQGLWPPAAAHVNATTWPNFGEGLSGEVYPWIFGIPPIDTATTGIFSSPGLVVNTSNHYLLIAGHPVEATSVKVRNFDDDSNGSYAVLEVADGSGRLCSYVDLDEVGPTVVYDEGAPYWIRWNNVATGGGLQGPDGTPFRGAGDHIVWWLERSTLRWDRGRVLALVPRLNAFRIDCAAVAAADARITPWVWIRTHILPLLPVSPRVGPEGLYFAWYEFDADRSLAVAILDTAAGMVERASAITYTPRDSVVNEVRLSYLLDAESDNYRKRLIVTGSADTAALETTAIRNGLCEQSDALYGRRVMEMSTDVVCDGDTAGRIALWKAQALALQHRLVTYTVPRDFAHLEPGNVVEITDAEVNLSAAVALVESMPWGPLESFDVVLRVLSSGREWAT